MLLLTPTGTLPSPRWRWWARVQVAALVVAFLSWVAHPMPRSPEYPEIGNPLGVAAVADGPLAAAFPVGALLILAGLPVGAGSLRSRFRRPRPGTAPAALAGGRGVLAAVALVVALTALAVERETASSSRRPWAAAWPCCPWPPGAAILRYRLDDLDRISRRTLAWALLMVLLGLG